METTREQDSAADFVSAWYGRCAVEESPLHHATRCVVITGLTDDVERSRWTVTPDGSVANVNWRDDAVGAYLRERQANGYEVQRTPMIVPREEAAT